MGSPSGGEGPEVTAHTSPFPPCSWAVPAILVIPILHTKELKAALAEMKGFTLCGNKPPRTAQGQSWDLTQVRGSPTL